MKITPYKQQLSHGCLVVCFLTLLKAKYNIAVSKKIETDLLVKGMDRKYKFYFTGCIAEILLKYKKSLSLVADNKFFANLVKTELAKLKQLKVSSEKISLKFLQDLVIKQPVICHIDDHFLGDYSHASHFIVLESYDKKTGKFLIVDPYYGKKKRISGEKLIDAVNSLRKHIRMCPVVMYLNT